MSMSVQLLASEGHETLRELPMPAYMYAVVALALFALALAVTWFFRGMAAKYGAAHVPHETDDTATGHSRGSHH